MSFSIYKAEQRGYADHGWLHARFSFSFAEYHNPQRMGFWALRVLNNDIIEPSGGFGMHPHNDMEIITLVLKGELEHEDSQGNHGVIKEGEVQYMSAGSGVYHSEKNPSRTKSVELFQIWIYPNVRGGEPRYEQRKLESFKKNAAWRLVASPDGRDDSIEIKQDAFFYAISLESEKFLELENLGPNRGRFIMVVDGSIEVQEHILTARDEIQIDDSGIYTLKALTQTQLIMFDLPMNLKRQKKYEII